MERSIIHLNVADFAAAVERTLDPRLAGRPLVIARPAAARATVFDMSEEAFREGVRKGMPLARALRLCPQARLLPPRPERYARAMRLLLEAALPYAPRVESGRADGHLFLDATGTRRLLGPPMDVAWRLRREVRDRLGLSPIWTLAPNKLVAKAASRLVKPEGEYIVAEGEEESFLAPLPLELIPGLERRDLAALGAFRLRRAGEVAALALEELRILCGERAAFLHEAVRGIDPSPVRAAGDPAPEVGGEERFDGETADEGELFAAAARLAERAGAELRRLRLAARRLRVSLRYADGGSAHRRVPLLSPTADDFLLRDAVRRAAAAAWRRRVRLRGLALACEGLVFPPAQLTLFPDAGAPGKGRPRLMAAVDRVRRRFGEEALRVAAALPPRAA
ncbi:MAG: hypothetical protein WHT06_10045 [Desulfobacterales bacterium]